MNHLRHITAALAVVALLLGAPSSYGLTSAAAPTKMQIPFGNSAGGAYVRTIPIASQIGIQNGAASYTDGFPPLNFTPISAGGVPPFGQDMNGILRETTALTRWYSAGGPILYDGVYQAAIGGYPRGAVVQSATIFGKLWYSTTDNNLTNPDTGGAGWSTIMDTVYAPLTGAGASGTWAIGIASPSAVTSSSPSAGIGYATGAGGFVIQATSKSTSITLNKKCGTFVTHASTLAAGAVAAFTFFNSTMTATSVIILSVQSGLAGAYQLSTTNIADGQLVIAIRNMTAGDLSDNITVNFAIINSVSN